MGYAKSECHSLLTPFLPSGEVRVTADLTTKGQGGGMCVILFDQDAKVLGAPADTDSLVLHSNNRVVRQILLGSRKEVIIEVGMASLGEAVAPLRAEYLIRIEGAVRLS
jgi:hypothetical protein